PYHRRHRRGPRSLWPGQRRRRRWAASSRYRHFPNTAPATAEIYTLSLHDALPISLSERANGMRLPPTMATGRVERDVVVTRVSQDRKSTRLNSSHVKISYAVFCLKKKTGKDGRGRGRRRDNPRRSRAGRQRRESDR